MAEQIDDPAEFFPLLCTVLSEAEEERSNHTRYAAAAASVVASLADISRYVNFNRCSDYILIT